MRSKIIIFITLALLLLNYNSVNAQTNSVDPVQQSLDAANQQIQDFRNQQTNNQYDPSEIPTEENSNGLETFGYILASFIIVVLAGRGLYKYTRPENIEERRNRRETARIAWQENQRIKREKLEQEKHERELKIKETREVKMARYEKLRKDIEAMPQYEIWRQAVFQKFGRKCAICGSTEKLEIDHSWKSFYSIIKEYGITNTIQAYESTALWDVNNGAPLCKVCHDRTASSIYRQMAKL